MSNEATSAGIPMGLTARQAHIAIMAWKALDNEPKIDVDRLAQVAGYPNASSARRMFDKTKEKIVSADDPDGPEDLVGLSGRSLELALVAWKCVSVVKIDAARLAELTGLTVVASARRQWNKVKKQISDATVNGVTGAAGPAAEVAVKGQKKDQTPKRKRAVKTDCDEDAPVETPSKKAKNEQEKVDEDGESDDDTGSA